jgi:hypothetical protein
MRTCAPCAISKNGPNVRIFTQLIHRPIEAKMRPMQNHLDLAPYGRENNEVLEDPIAKHLSSNKMTYAFCRLYIKMIYSFKMIAPPSQIQWPWLLYHIYHIYRIGHIYGTIKMIITTDPFSKDGIIQTLLLLLTPLLPVIKHLHK